MMIPCFVLGVQHTGNASTVASHNYIFTDVHMMPHTMTCTSVSVHIAHAGRVCGASVRKWALLV